MLTRRTASGRAPADARAVHTQPAPMLSTLSKSLRTAERRVFALALICRIAVLSAMVVMETAFPDLDSSAHLQNFPCEGVDPAHVDAIKSTPLDGLAPWDSVYFVRIAKCGYQSDMTHAFFPALPLAMRYTAKVTGLELLSHLIPIESVYAALGLVFSAVAAAAAAVALHRLTVAATGDFRLAAASTLLFCVNPASVFYSAAYTESIFAAATWWGLAMLPQRRWTGVALLAMAGAVRSNGILGAWFLVHPFIVETGRERKMQWKAAAATAAAARAIFTPYVAFQVYGYRLYCSAEGPQPLPPWCSYTPPSIYSYVQSTYWDVRFLRFYHHINRWPWFLQSAPVLSLAVAACWAWASADWRRAVTLGITASKRRQSGFLSDAVGPYIYHLAGMTAMAALVMHVNVATRFLSSSPALYWYAAGLLLAGDKGGAQRWRWTREGIWLWALASAALGALLFPNFFPWT